MVSPQDQAPIPTLETFKSELPKYTFSSATVLRVEEPSEAAALILWTLEWHITAKQPLLIWRAMGTENQFKSKNGYVAMKLKTQKIKTFIEVQKDTTFNSRFEQIWYEGDN